MGAGRFLRPAPSAQTKTGGAGPTCTLLFQNTAEKPCSTNRFLIKPIHPHPLKQRPLLLLRQTLPEIHLRILIIPRHLNLRKPHRNSMPGTPRNIRILQLQTGNPSRLRLLHTLPDECRNLEPCQQLILRRCAKRRQTVEK